jgi:hypothetical protein
MESNLSQRSAALYKLWDRTRNIVSGQHAPYDQDGWNEQVYYLSQSGIGTEEALNYLYAKKPSFEAFMTWLQTTYVPGQAASEVHGDVLTAEDRDFWNKNGYIVIRDAVPALQCEAARAAIWEYLDADPLAPDSWYRPHSGKSGMMLSFFQHPALDSNRNSARIKKVFTELYNSAEIYLLVDKVSFNPPETGTHHFNGSPLHWDVSLQLPIPFVLQGLLYLNDVSATDGAFHCVPGFHNQIDKWQAGLPENADPRREAMKALRPVAVPGNAGDLVIWHQALPHCATPNRGASPRMVQYIAYKPVKVTEGTQWK